MNHSFDIEIATKYGVNCAILLQHIYFWTEKNKANDKNFFDGFYWTYNSAKAFNHLFPYMSERQISYALKQLEENGLIKVGNYNEDRRDKTKWYAVTKLGYCILQNVGLHSTKCTSASYKSDEPLPDINTDINTDIETDNIPLTPKKESKANSDCSNVLELFSSTCSDLPKPQKLTDSRKKAIARAEKDIQEFGGWEKFFKIIQQSDFLSGRKSDWKADFDWVLKPNNMVKIMEGNYSKDQKKEEPQNIPEWISANRY